MTNRFKCPECGGEFDEPDNVRKKSLKLGVGFVKYDAKGCPWCGEAMSTTAENYEETELLE